jgi:hypothetical protein
MVEKTEKDLTSFLEKKDKSKSEPEDEEQKKSKTEIKIEKIKKVREEEQQIEDDLKKVHVEQLKSNVYLEMDAYVEMVARGISYGTIIEGPGGTGKTWRILNNLKDVDYAYTDSFTTPAAFYIWMYKNRNKEVLIIDDIANFMNNEKILAFLKGGLWEVNGKRIIHYMTTKPLQDENGEYIPNTFILSARMIIITNRLNKRNPHLNAVLTRVNYTKVEIDFDELMNILEQIVKKGFPGLEKEECIEVYEFIKTNASESTAGLNIRSLIKCFQQRVYSKAIENPDLWKRLAMISILMKNPTLVIVEEIENNPKLKTVEDKIKEFKSRTGKVRSTYFRLKEQLTQAGDNLKEKKTGDSV